MAKATKKEPLAHVMLKPLETGVFRRSVRGKKGEVVEKLEFQPETPVPIMNEEQIAAIFGDIGNALVIVSVNDFGQPRVDWEATNEVISQRNVEETDTVVEAQDTPTSDSSNLDEPGSSD